MKELVVLESKKISFPQELLIPTLNIICAIKVTFGTWSIIRLFILKRGLLN